ncbi:MAG TPA: RNA polymerase sigma factor [Clostridiales bacterium]|nr:RNA polymerase sigma factor [Clostridiales bacterium]
MSNDLQRTSKIITELYNEYVDMVYRICFMLLRNPTDAEDVVQAVFVKVIEKDVQFKNKEHEKAWFIVTTQNHCKNQLKHWWKKNIAFDMNYHDAYYSDEHSEILEIVLKLPDKYKMPIYLHYYEGYSTDEIANLLKINASTLRSRLKKGREILKNILGGELLE